MTELERLLAERKAIAHELDEAGIEHSGHVAQVERIKMLVARDKERGHGIVRRQLVIREQAARIEQLEREAKEYQELLAKITPKR